MNSLLSAIVVILATGSSAWLNVRDFKSIQAAVDALPATGGVVYIPGSADLPGGAYSVTTSPSFGTSDAHVALRLPAGKAVHLLGDGKGVTILRASQCDSDLVEVRGDQSSLEGFTIENSCKTGTNSHSRGIVIGRPSQVLTGAAIRDVRVSNSPGWGLYVRGAQAGDASLSIVCVYDRLDIWNNLNPSDGGIYVGRGCTTQSFRNCYVEPFRGSAARLEAAEGVSFTDCVFEANLDHSHPYVVIRNSNQSQLNHCWFEAHGATDTSRFIQMTGPLHSIEVIGCRFARDTLVDSLNAIQIDGVCKSIVIIDPEMMIPGRRRVMGVGDIVISNPAFDSAYSSEVTVVGGIIATQTGFKPPSLVDRSPGLSGPEKDRRRMPEVTTQQLTQLAKSAKGGDMVFNRDTQRIDVFTGANGWVGLPTGPP